MNNMEELKQLFNDLQTHALSLSDPETLNKLKQAKESRRKTKEAEEAHLQRQRDENDKLQAELDELRRERKELEAQLALRKQEDVQREEACRAGQQKIEELEEEYRVVLEELSDVKKSVEGHGGTLGIAQTKPKQLQMAIYQGLGVSIHLDQEERATGASIRSLDNQELRLIPINGDEPPLSIANRIWDIIS